MHVCGCAKMRVSFVCVCILLSVWGGVGVGVCVTYEIIY